MGANRPGTRRKARLKRAKREQERLARKAAASEAEGVGGAEAAGKEPGAPTGKGKKVAAAETLSGKQP